MRRFALLRRGFVRRARRDERGSVALIAALGGSVILAASALAVDVGSVYLQSRKLQGMADLAAIAAARDLPAAEAAAEATVAANAWGGPVDTRVVKGRYDGVASKALGQRFVEGAASPNAARVELSAQTDLFFGQAILGSATMPIRRQATATRAEFASFSIGTRLASLNGGMANSLLSALTGSNLSLSVMDYQALAGADVDLFAYTKALRTRASIQAGSFKNTLDTKLKTGDALSALSDVLTAAGEVQAAAGIKKIALASSGLPDTRLSALIDLGQIGDQDKIVSAAATRVQVSASDLANALLLTAQEGRQVKLDLGSSVPGVADLDLFLAIGERPNNAPWLTIDDAGGVVVRTNQARLYIRAQALSVLGLLGAKPISLPILVELASGEAKLASMSCPGEGASSRVALDVRPSVGKLTIGDIDTNKLNDFKRELSVSPATIIEVPLLLSLTGSAQTKIGGEAWRQVEFTRGEIDAGVVKSVATTDIAQATLSSLISKTSLTVKLLVIPLPTLNLSVLSALNALGAPLDGVLNGLTDLLGIRLGEADVRVHGMRCRDAVLVA